MQSLMQLEEFQGATMRKTGKSAKHGRKKDRMAGSVSGAPAD